MSDVQMGKLNSKARRQRRREPSRNAFSRGEKKGTADKGEKDKVQKDI